MTSSTQPDYSAIIRREVEECVRRLIKECRNTGKRHEHSTCWAISEIKPQYVLLGDLVGLHHGRSVFGADECIAGLPVKRDHNPREWWDISVCADNVRFEYEYSVEEHDTEFRDVIVTERFC